MALRFPDKLKSNNSKEFGIIDAIEVSGHRFTKKINDLYQIPDAILSPSKVNKDNDSIGQLWYVLEANVFYQLIDWGNRKNGFGWKKFGRDDVFEDAASDNLIYARMNGKWVNPFKNSLGDSSVFGVDQNTITTELSKKQDILKSGVNIATINGNDLTKGTDILFTKESVGLGYVTNDAQVKRTEMGVANGVATLDENGKLNIDQLPENVTDVFLGEYVDPTTFLVGDQPAEKIPGKFYIDLIEGSKVYTWNNIEFILLFSSDLNIDVLNKKIDKLSERFLSDNQTEGSVRFLAREEAEKLLTWSDQTN